MSRLPRPHISDRIRLKVAMRQLGYSPQIIVSDTKGALKHRALAAFLFGELGYLANQLGCSIDQLELHHRPSLVNRRRKRNGDYDPPANDPAYLVYLADDDHDIETRVRGQHGQHSDLGMVRKNKRIAANRNPKRRKTKIVQREEYRWPSRPFRKKV